MGDRDPRDRHKTLATLRPSFVMPELDITHSSWLGNSFPLLIDNCVITRHRDHSDHFQIYICTVMFRASRLGFCVCTAQQNENPLATV